MVPAITFRKFLQRLAEKYGVRNQPSKAVLIGPKGPADTSYLIREVPGVGTRVAATPKINLDEHVAVDLIRSICALLNIDPRDFGYELKDFDE